MEGPKVQVHVAEVGWTLVFVVFGSGSYNKLTPDGKNIYCFTYILNMCSHTCMVPLNQWVFASAAVLLQSLGSSSYIKLSGWRKRSWRRRNWRKRNDLRDESGCDGYLGPIQESREAVKQRHVLFEIQCMYHIIYIYLFLIYVYIRWLRCMLAPDVPCMQYLPTCGLHQW